jgi:hypothetical protein
MSSGNDGSTLLLLAAALLALILIVGSSTTPKQIIGEKQILTYSGTNLAPLPTGWVDDHTWIQVPTGATYEETNGALKHLGNYTLRIDPSANWNDAFDFANSNNFIPISGGDHVVMMAWLKADGTIPANQEGAWLGFDYYTVNEGALITGIGTPLEASLGKGWDTYVDPDKDDWFIHWGEDWTLVTWDFTVPTQAQANNNANGLTHGNWYDIGCFIPWVTRMGNSNSIWASEVIVYVNPAEETGPEGVSFSDDFETNDLMAWTGTWTSDGSSSTANDQVYAGSYAGKFVVSANDGYADAYKEFVDTSSMLYGSVYVRFSALPTVGKAIILYMFNNTANNNPVGSIGLGFDGSAKWKMSYLKNSVYTTLYSSGDAPLVDTWYKLTMKVQVSASVGTVEVWIDDSKITSLCDTSGFDNNDWGLLNGCFCGVDAYTEASYPVTVWADDFTVSDTYTGSALPFGPIAHYYQFNSGDMI